MAPPKDKFERDVVTLVKVTTNFKEEDVNFSHCVQYVLSTLHYHQFLDVNSHSVDRVIDGLYNKFIIHSQKDKAEAFRVLTRRFLNCPCAKELDEPDALHRLISVLLNLANNPTKATYDGPPLYDYNPDADSAFNWGSYLLEGERSESPNSLDYNSDWSECEDDCEEVFSCAQSAIEPKKVTEECRCVVELPAPSKVVDASQFSGRAWLKENLISQYWTAPHMISEASNHHSCTDLHKNWEKFLEESGVVFVRTNGTVLTEYQIIREILWMLQGTGQSFICSCKSNKYEIREDIRLSHLTSRSLHEVLLEVIKYGNIVLKLKQFVNTTIYAPSCPRKASKEDFTPLCQTYEAYATGLSEYLQEMTGTLSELEKNVQKQDQVSSLSVLMVDLLPHLEGLVLIDSIHTAGVESVPKDTPNWKRAVKLLNVLYSSAVSMDALGSGGAKMVGLLLKLFLKTFKPYADIADAWINFGIMNDRYEEFVIERKTEESQEEFWRCATTLRANSVAEGNPVASEEVIFLEPVMGNLIQAGKSMDLLRCLGKLNICVDSQVCNDPSNSLYSVFLHNLKKEVLVTGNERSDYYCDAGFHSGNASPSRDNMPHFEVAEVLEQLKSVAEYDPLLMVNFKQLLQVDANTTRCQHDDEMNRLLLQLKPPFLCPLNWGMQKALFPYFAEKYHKTCQVLISVLQKDYNLLSYMSTMRKFFLMEAGDVMFNFYSSLFEKIHHGEYWQDSSMLTINLQDAIGSQYPTLAQRMSISFKPNPEVNNLSIDVLDGLKLQLQIPWPVDIVITNHMQETYNQIFKFLLQIKWAKYSLDILRFQDLESGRLSLLQLPDNTKAMSGNVAPQAEKLRSMYLLRMKFLYFVNNIHNYIMTQILHSTGIELEKNLQGATDLEQLITSHSSYIDSLHQCCLLKEKELALPRRAIKWILNLCIKFRHKWDLGLRNCSMDDIRHIESELTRCCQFLSTFHEKMTKQGTFINWLFTFVLQDWLQPSV